MPARRRSRQRALQVLFQCDARAMPVDESLAFYYETLFSAEEDPDVEPLPLDTDPFMEALSRGTVERKPELDSLIAQRAENWRLERMPLVDRNILRMAIYEMKYEGTPAAVVIDEALELGRRYSEEEAVPFLNGVLDAVRRLIAAPPAQPAV